MSRGVSDNDIVLGITTSAAVETAVVTKERASAYAAGGQALESLLPLVERALHGFGAPLRTVALIAVDTGPGSFTGLRIGVAFAKSLAQAAGIPIVGVSGYDVAHVARAQSFPRISVVAGKPDYYYARVQKTAASRFEFAHGQADALARALFSVTGAQVDLRSLLFAGVAGDRAKAVALLGLRQWQRGDRTDWRDVVIDYGQRPNAVVNWESRAAQGGRPRAATKHTRT